MSSLASLSLSSSSEKEGDKGNSTLEVALKEPVYESLARTAPNANEQQLLLPRCFQRNQHRPAPETISAKASSLSRDAPQSYPAWTCSANAVGAPGDFHLNRLSLCPIPAPRTQQGLVKASRYQLPALLGDRPYRFLVNPKRQRIPKPCWNAPDGFFPNSTTDTPLCRRPTRRGNPPPQTINPYLREASPYHCSTVDHGAFLPHEEPWNRWKRGRPSVSTERSGSGDLCYIDLSLDNYKTKMIL